MAVPLTPSLYAEYLALRRRGWMALARPFVAPALLVLGCVIVACASFYREIAWGLAGSAMLALAGSFALMRSRLTDALVRSRYGWCGALPVRARTTALTLLALTMAAVVAAAVWGTVWEVLVAMPAPHRDDLRLALLALVGGLIVGTAAAIVQVFRKGAVAKSRHADGIREPLFALPWLHDPRLPHLLDWQRRAALVKWRRGGRVALIGLVLVGIPDGTAVPQVIGLVLLVSSLLWLEVVVKACAEVTVAAVELLGAAPLPRGGMCRASLRYPLVAAGCAVILAVVGTLLMKGGLLSLPIWCACAIAISVLPLRRIGMATRPDARSP